MPPKCSASRRRTVLAASCTIIAVAWLVVLPRLGNLPAVQQRIRFLEQQRIDPSAMYYTDLEIMDRVLDHSSEIQQQNPAIFWDPHAGMKLPSASDESTR